MTKGSETFPDMQLRGYSARTRGTMHGKRPAPANAWVAARVGKAVKGTSRKTPVLLTTYLLVAAITRSGVTVFASSSSDRDWGTLRAPPVQRTSDKKSWSVPYLVKM